MRRTNPNKGFDRHAPSAIAFVFAMVLSACIGSSSAETQGSNPEATEDQTVTSEEAPDLPDTTSTSVASTVPPHQPVVSDEDLADEPWTLLFNDDFDETLDSEVWTSCYWWSEVGCTNGSTGERQWYLPDQRRVEDGSLRLYGADDPVRDEDGVWYDYRSGMVTTGRSTYIMDAEPSLAFTYGYVEARFRTDPGQGIWPAIWMLPLSHNSRPEIDIVEILGHQPDTIEMHMHLDDDNGESMSFGSNYRDSSIADNWNVVGVNWTPDSVVWYVDGVERFRVEELVPDEPMYLLANLAIGGEWPGDPDETTIFPATFEIDYIRVWQQGEPWFESTGRLASP